MSTDYLLKDELEQPDATAPLPKEERVTEPCRTVSFDEANAYLSTVRAVHGKMAAGVGLCILSPIALLVLGAWSDGTPNEERMAGLGVIFLLLFVALGLLLILPAAIRLKAFEYLEKEQIALAYGVEGIVERQKQEYAPTYRRSMTQAWCSVCWPWCRSWARPCWEHQASGSLPQSACCWPLWPVQYSCSSGP